MLQSKSIAPCIAGFTNPLILESDSLFLVTPSSPKRNKDTLILPPSPKAIYALDPDTKPLQIIERCQIQHASSIFDPTNSSPSSEFMNTLKMRMSVYYDPVVQNTFDTK